MSNTATYVEALDAFPGQASDAALLDEDAEDLERGLDAWRRRHGSRPTLLIPDDRALAHPAERFACADVRQVPRLHPLDDLSALRSWLDATRDARLVRASEVAAHGKELRGGAATDRWVSVVGAVRSPRTWRVPIGTAVDQLVRLSGGSTREDAVVFRTRPLGSVRRASSVRSDDAVFVVMPGDAPLAVNDSLSWDLAVRRIVAGCSRCSRCDDVCPAQPRVGARELADALRWGGAGGGPAPRSSIAACIGCRACEAACPSGLPIGRVAHAVAERVRASRDVAESTITRFTPRAAFARRVGVERDAIERADARSHVSRVRFVLGGDASSRLEPLVRSGARVWCGEAVAHGPGTRARIVAPFTGVVRVRETSLTIRREDE